MKAKLTPNKPKKAFFIRHKFDSEYNIHKSYPTLKEARSAKVTEYMSWRNPKDYEIVEFEMVPTGKKF